MDFVTYLQYVFDLGDIARKLFDVNQCLPVNHRRGTQCKRITLYKSMRLYYKYRTTLPTNSSQEQSCTIPST